MVARTRLDCVIGSTAGMRQSVAEAAWHARHRKAFGKTLIDQPVMRAVLTDLQLGVEVATWTMMHLAAAHDDPSDDAQAFRRITTAIAKYWICKRGPGHAYEALECLGGNGYTEDFQLARRYREQPLLAIWEGSGNVIVLDVLRALTRDPESVKQLMAFFEGARGFNAIYDARYEALAIKVSRGLRAVVSQDESAIVNLQLGGRVLVEELATLYQAAVLVQYASEKIAESFVLGRLSDARGREYGAIPEDVSVEELLERTYPR